MPGTLDLKSLLNGLDPGLAEGDLADINRFLTGQVLVSNKVKSPEALAAAVTDFIRLRVRYWLRRVRHTDDEVSMADVELAIKHAVNAGARKDRMLGLANKLSRALERVGSD